MDTFGALRGDISNGRHHGDDIFAPLDSAAGSRAPGRFRRQDRREPALVTRRTGKPLLLRAPLAFSPLAVNGSKVNAGDVPPPADRGRAGKPRSISTLTFPSPGSALASGHDGAVNPTSYLLQWKHLQDVSFAGGDAWAPLHSLGNAPKCPDPAGGDRHSSNPGTGSSHATAACDQAPRREGRQLQLEEEAEVGEASSSGSASSSPG